MAQNGSENKKHGIQARQRATIPILASSASITEAARLSNISRRTLTRWLQDEDFRNQVAEFQQQAAELARVTPGVEFLEPGYMEATPILP